MSMLAPVPDHDHDEVTLPITWPKSKERFDLNGKGLVTDQDMVPMMMVRGTFTGVVSGLTNKFTEGTAKWVVIVDDCDIEPL